MSAAACLAAFILPTVPISFCEVFSPVQRKLGPHGRVSIVKLGTKSCTAVTGSGFGGAPRARLLALEL